MLGEMFANGQQPTVNNQRSLTGRLWPLALLVAASLACGGFAPRPVVEPTPWPTWTPRPTATATRPPTPTETLTPVPPTPTLAPPTATPIPGQPLLGAKARVVARTGVNIRQSPSTTAPRLGRFGAGVLVAVREGPVEADGFRWWRVEDGQGLSGWVAEGDAVDRWLDARIGAPRPVNRPVRLGDTVSVTVPAGIVLAIRFEPSTNSLAARRLAAGAILQVEEGPVAAEGLRWWLVSAEGGRPIGWAAEADADERWLSPVE
jgi:hypothetical protein